MNTAPTLPANEDWPLPSLHCQVQWDTAVMSFEAVSGLEATTTQQTRLKPGLSQCGHVTMTRGMFRASSTFWDWFNQIKSNAIRRAPAIITLLDPDGRPVMVWTLSNAWLTGITGTNLKAEGTEVSITSIEIAHEGLSCTRH
ncbi:MAG: phage tail protein [Leptothrix sp. (in: b-proteobacteria)]